MANKFANPVEFDLVKTIPALQGVNMEGVEPFNGNQKQYQQLIGVIGDAAKGVYEANQTKAFNNIMLDMDNINQDTAFKIQEQLGVDWASTEEGRNAAVGFMNEGIQKQKALLLESKGAYSEDRWKQLDNYFKKSTYTQLQTMQSNVYQGYVKQGSQELALSQGMFNDRISGILATNALNHGWSEPSEEIDSAINQQLNYIDSNRAILKDAGVVEQKYKLLTSTFLQTLDYKLKKTIINNTQNPAFWTKMVDNNGEVVVDDNGNPVYLRDEAGSPIPDLEAKSRAVQAMSENILTSVSDGSVVDEWGKRYKLDTLTIQALDGKLKSEGLEAVNKSVMQMDLLMGEQRKDNEGKISLAYDSANIKSNNAYKAIVDKSEKDNNIIQLGGMVDGTAYTSATFIRPKVNPANGAIVDKSPLQKITGKEISDLTRNNIALDGFINDGEMGRYTRAMESASPVDSLSQEFKKTLQEYKDPAERDAWRLNMGAAFSNKGISESAINVIAKDPNTLTESELDMKGMLNDVLVYKKTYKADYNTKFEMIGQANNNTYTDLIGQCGGNAAVLNTVIQYVGSNADNLSNQFPELQSALSSFRNARDTSGVVDPKLFMQGVVAAATDSPAFYEFVKKKIPLAQKIVIPTRTYTIYSLDNDQKTELANRGASREYEAEIDRKAYQMNIPPQKLKQISQGRTGVKVEIPKETKTEKRSYLNMTSF